MQTEPLTIAQFEILLKNAAKIISAPRGTFELTEAQRNLAVLFSTGVFVVVNNANLNPHIMMLRELMRRRGYQVVEEFSAEDVMIRALYDEKRTLG